MANHDAHGPKVPDEIDLKEAIDRGYESDGVSLSVLMKWGFGLAVLLVATSAAMLILFKLLQYPPFAATPVERPLVQAEGVHPPPGTPILQDNPLGDARPDNNSRKGIDNIREYRRDEEIKMDEYAKQDGKIHIPIERAMELTIKEIPFQQEGEAPTGVTPTPEMNLHPDISAPRTIR
jgi:hypothetical protein